MPPHTVFRDDDDDDENSSDQHTNGSPDNHDRDPTPTDPADLVGERRPNSRFKAHPVIPSEVSETKFTTEHPTTGTEDRAAEKAILPTGGVAGRVQYIGKVKHKSSGSTDDGTEFAEVTMEDAGVSVTAIAYNVPRSDYAYLSELNPPQFIRVTGWLWADDQGDSAITVENTHPVSIRSWINHTTTAAEAAFTRVTALQKYNSTNPNLETDTANQSNALQTIHGFRQTLRHYVFDHQSWCERISDTLDSVDKAYTTHINTGV